MEIGQLLKEARETKQLTLDDIQEMTKIQKRYLKAIENNDFDSLPGRFYARAFIKEYAIVVDLDDEALLQQFDGHKEVEEEAAPQSTVRRTRRSRTPKKSAILSYLPTVIVVILIIGALFVAWTLTQKALSTDNADSGEQAESDEIIRDVEKPEEEPPVSDEDEEDEDAETEEEEEVEEEPEVESEFEVEEVGTGSPPESELTFTYTEDKVELSFDVEADAYISIAGESGQRYFDGILEPNVDLEAYDLTDEEIVYLNIGNTTGLTVQLNDVTMEYPIEPTDSVHQKYMIHLEKAR